jgi:hypothetical protein
LPFESCDRRTNSDRLDLDTLLDVGVSHVISILVLEDILAAESVDKGRASYMFK